jgi:glycosyltransferase involved in cell wall biosynthesis
MSSAPLRLVPAGPAATSADAAAAAVLTRTPPSVGRRAKFAAARLSTELADRNRLWAAADPDLELTVVVPFYNPGLALRRMMTRLVGCLRLAGVRFEVIAVSDGSTDGSERTLGGLGHEVRVLVAPVNQGKGAALHMGFAQARGAWVGFVDADGDIDPAHLVTYLNLAREGGHAGVYANKRHASSVSGSSAFRKLVSIVYSSLVTLMFFLGIRDTQTGCKVFRRDVLAGILPSLREQRFAFDLEFFVAAKAAGITDLVDAPVRLETRVAGSTVTSRAILRTIKDTFGIFARIHLRDYYAARAAALDVRHVSPTPHVIDELGFAPAAVS